MTLHSSTGKVSIFNDYNQLDNRATDYDWNTGGNIFRDGLIRAERVRAGLNDTHGFRVFYHGIGNLKH